MANIIVSIVLLVIISLAAGYVVWAKKKGRKCIGCPGNCCSKKDKDSICSTCCCTREDFIR